MPGVELTAPGILELSAIGQDGGIHELDKEK